MFETLDLVQHVNQDPNVIKLLDSIVAGNNAEVKPTLDLASEQGFSYPQMEDLLGMSTYEVMKLLDYLATSDYLEKRCYDKLLFCPHCTSLNLRPILHCLKCDSVNISHGRILEHFSCSNIGMENDYMTDGKYVCPKCDKELRFLGTDYRSLGFKYKCHDCGELNNGFTLKLQCLKCMTFFADDETKEIIMYSYRINEERRHWLEFELRPKSMFLEFLKERGYEVFEGIKFGDISQSADEHMINILARRDDGFITYTVGIGVIIDEQGKEIGLDEVFNFDDQAYDIGLQDKVLFIIPALSSDARQFAQRQQIVVFEDEDLKKFLDSTGPCTSRHVRSKLFRFENKTKFVEYLKILGYQVEEKARIQGRSGVEHVVDILAQSDDRFITYKLVVGIIIADKAIGIDAVSSFDAKAYDIGIHYKMLLVSPRLSQESKRFAQQQKIEVFEVVEADKLI